MTDLVFEDPPSRERIWGVWQEALLPLLEHPGRWAKVRQVPATSARSHKSNLERRRVDLPAGNWSFEYDDKGWIYARYDGPEGSE